MAYIGQINAAVEEGKLTGYSCAKCGRKGVTFAVACPSCGSVDLTPFTFSGRGTIRTFTILTVPSEQFVNDAPYTYVVVDLDEGCGSVMVPDRAINYLSPDNRGAIPKASAFSQSFLRKKRLFMHSL